MFVPTSKHHPTWNKHPWDYTSVCPDSTPRMHTPSGSPCTLAAKVWTLSTLYSKSNIKNQTISRSILFCTFHLHYKSNISWNIMNGISIIPSIIFLLFFWLYTWWNENGGYHLYILQGPQLCCTKLLNCPCTSTRNFRKWKHLGNFSKPPSALEQYGTHRESKEP